MTEIGRMIRGDGIKEGREEDIKEGEMPYYFLYLLRVSGK